MVFFSFWGESVGFLFVKHFRMSLVFFRDLFGEGDRGAPFYPCFGPWHFDFSFFPVDLGVKGPQPGVSEYYSIFPQARFVESYDVSLVPALDGHFAVSLNSSCLVGCAV